MIEILDKHNCCGCEACVQICPKQCISFNEDAEGFRYPMVDKRICIDCGLCEKVCPILNKTEERKPIKVYAAKTRDEEELLASSSGGLFILFAKEILCQGGVVFGAKFDENWNVVHAYAETEKDLKAFMGSKYVQSRIGNTYREAKDFLEAGRQVLFSGTSCQIAGLKRYLRKEYDNLLTIDVVCHGVPSPKVWRLYLDEVMNSAGKDARISDITFRDKHLGWRKYSFILKTTKGYAIDNNIATISEFHRNNPYMQAFIANLILRPACEKCRFKGGRSLSDITLADFWGIWNVKSEMFDDKGTSLLIINSKKGIEITNNLHLLSCEVDLKDAIKSNPAYYKSSIKHRKRKDFFRALDDGNTPIFMLMNKLSQTTRFQKIQLLIRRIIYKKILN